MLVFHDDGCWYAATLLDAYRIATGWRAVVRYSVAPGMQFQRGVWYDELRPSPEPQDDEQGDADEAHGHPDGEHVDVW